MCTMDSRVPGSELQQRMKRFKARMEEQKPDYELVVIFGNINLYYFTGTMQDSMLCIPRDGEPTLWVRKSYERAKHESEFPCIEKMGSFRDAARAYTDVPDTVYLETDIVPLALYQRFSKYFPISHVESVDRELSMVRAVKSPFEISLMEESGRIHARVLEESVPDMLTEGMRESEFASRLYGHLVDEGHHGIARFGMFNTEMLLGQIGFGENSLYPTYFDGPGGSVGLCPAVPLLGDRKRRLKKGDLVFVDVGCGCGGYHTDKTMTYMFGASLPDDVIEKHNRCVEVQNHLASLLVPGNIPSQIYRDVMAALEPEFLENFMGYKDRKVKFLGHGVGLLIDEIPVIAEGFDEPLEENMVFALEPKKGIPGVGMVGIENTFVVSKGRGRCITGTNPGLIRV
ncbi:Xaa-Pro peptidase family protein [Methanospirillum hungatei]|uniref:M24 family metallopeptidase n=1 Tax=Methanospirillum hungatei TaxID=2203 RepID=UPI0026F1E4E7|nr:Xaa-Pro peptidase family protein [Methanospirillum hungatei]MCA1915001.1 Xaa-Pro peptidase family protein [Methanospirillum hungatei]